MALSVALDCVPAFDLLEPVVLQLFFLAAEKALAAEVAAVQAFAVVELPAAAVPVAAVQAAAVQIFADDGVVRGLDDCRQALGVARAKHINALLQPLGQAGKNAGLLPLPAFGFAMVFSVTHPQYRATPTPP